MEKEKLVIKDVINLLKEGFVLSSIIDKRLYYFKQRKNYILVKNDNSEFYLSEYDFIELYKNYFFFIVDNEEDFIDEERDKEYYSMNKLKK